MPSLVPKFDPFTQFSYQPRIFYPNHAVTRGEMAVVIDGLLD